MHCPTCGCSNFRFISTRRMWECPVKHPRNRFLAKIGTIFEASPLGLNKWLAAIWLIANRKNGVSSYEIHTGIGLTQKTRWFMLHRIRLAMESGSYSKSGGVFDADETFIACKSKNTGKARRERTITGSGVSAKEVNMGVLRRVPGNSLSQATAKHIPNRRKPQLQGFVRDVAEPESSVYSDSLMSYAGPGANTITRRLTMPSNSFVRKFISTE